jgi:hypothetical protein
VGFQELVERMVDSDVENERKIERNRE